MIKIILRILVILAVSSLVSGAVYLIATNSASSSISPDFAIRPIPSINQTDSNEESVDQNLTDTTNRPPRDFDERGGLEIIGLIQHGLAIVVITLVVVLIQNGYARLIKKRAV